MRGIWPLLLFSLKKLIFYYFLRYLVKMTSANKESMKAENITTIDSLNLELPLLKLEGVTFSQWISIGRIVEDPSMQRRAFNLSANFPANKEGNYIVAASINGTIRPIYTGISVGKGVSTNIRNRLRMHITPSQNEKKNDDKVSGLLEGTKRLLPDTVYYVSFYECTNRSTSENIESILLFEFDFACNTNKKRLPKPRFDDLTRLVYGDFEDKDSVVDEPSLTTVNADAEAEAKGNLKEELAGLGEKVAKKKIIKRATNDGALVLVCGCLKRYQLPKLITSVDCSCGSKFVFS